ncbi:serine/threonine-protein kinase [Microbacterium rhizophilus]|uniref:serine/threonine-protein kinase n=1 Tax=Microbacterium rhizophilus TaxID=3138934 RepID=UPI0031E5AB81
MTSASICEAGPGAFPTAGVDAGHAAGSGLLGDRYKLGELVGQGGMGRVYRATDELLGRTVAIKMFPAAATDEADRARRESETRLLASLSHPSLVTLYDADTLEDGSGYLVMEYVDGGTLADWIARGPMAPHHVAHVAADLGEALHAVHAGGVIHRDIKPPNVLLRSSYGRPFRATLADFGIAYLMDTARMTTPGMAVGTAAYFSPEQARGAQPSPASDIYALGLVLMEALTGRRAFPQTTPIEAAIARLHTPPEVPAGFGYGWRSLLTAMTAPDPAARPTALEVAERARELTTPDAAPQDVPTEAAVPLVSEPPAAAPPTPGPMVTEPPVTAAAPVEDATRVIPVEHALRSRRRRRHRARRTLMGRAIVAGAGAAVIAAGIWSGVATAGLEHAATSGRQLETRIVDRASDTSEPAAPAPAAPAPADAAVQQGATTTGTQTAGNQGASQSQGGSQSQGPSGSAGRGQGAPADAGAGDKTHGNGNGNGRSDVGTSGTGHGAG